MVSHSKSDFLFRDKTRHWPKQPTEVRLERWYKRVAKATSKYQRPFCTEIRQSLATALGLPTRWVQLRADGTLWHDSRLEPIADLHQYSQ